MHLLLFLLPEHMVKPVIKGIIHTLHITTTGKGLAFAFPLTHMKGISLSRKEIFESRHDTKVKVQKEKEEQEHIKDEIKEELKRERKVEKKNKKLLKKLNEAISEEISEKDDK